MIKIKDIAKMAEVSPSTVSNVINGRKNVSSQTSERILKLCENMSYYPNIMAKNLKGGKTNIIAFNIPNFNDNSYLKIAKGIKSLLKKKDKTLLICEKDSIEKFVRNKLVDGVIIYDNLLEKQFLKNLTNINPNIKIVLINKRVNIKNIQCIVINNYRLMGDLVELFHAKGYSKFNYVGTRGSGFANIEKYSGFRDTLAKKDLKFTNANFYSSDNSVKSGFKAGELMIKENNLSEIIACGENMIALGIIKALKNHNLRVPEDVKVVGFGDNEFGFSSVIIPYQKIGILSSSIIIKSVYENMESKSNIFYVEGKIVL